MTINWGDVWVPAGEPFWVTNPDGSKFLNQNWKVDKRVENAIGASLPSLPAPLTSAEWKRIDELMYTIAPIQHMQPCDTGNSGPVPVWRDGGYTASVSVPQPVCDDGWTPVIPKTKTSLPRPTVVSDDGWTPVIPKTKPSLPHPIVGNDTRTRENKPTLHRSTGGGDAWTREWERVNATGIKRPCRYGSGCRNQDGRNGTMKCPFSH
jgi:hypothetical protein